MSAHVFKATKEMEQRIPAVCKKLKGCCIYYYLLLLGCKNGEVLLMNGSLPSVREGRVEICYDQVYRTICDDYWDEADANVICKQLNYTGSGNIALMSLTSSRLRLSHVLFLIDNFAIMRASMRYGKGNGSILLDDLMCNGDEVSLLLECLHKGIWENDCASDHSEDAGVICGGNY